MLNATGDAFLQTPKGEFYLGVLYIFPSSSPYQPPYILGGGDTQATFVLDLDWRALDLVEEKRSGDLTLKGNVHALCASLDAVPQKGSGQAIDSLLWVSGEIRRGNRNLFAIYLTEWLEILNELGYGRRRLLEILIPSPEGAGQEVLAHIDAADRAMVQGQYDTVLVSCRKALESMDKAATEQNLDLRVRLGSESKAEFIEALRKRLKEFLSKGAHPGSTINRRDADFALILTKNLLAYIGSSAGLPKAEP